MNSVVSESTAVPPWSTRRITGISDQGIGRQAAGHIRSAALRAQNQLADGEGLPLEQGRLFHHLPGCPHRLLHRGNGAAALLDDKLPQGLVGSLAVASTTRSIWQFSQPREITMVP